MPRSGLQVQGGCQGRDLEVFERSVDGRPIRSVEEGGDSGPPPQWARWSQGVRGRETLAGWTPAGNGPRGDVACRWAPPPGPRPWTTFTGCPFATAGSVCGERDPCAERAPGRRVGARGPWSPSGLHAVQPHPTSRKSDGQRIPACCCPMGPPRRLVYTDGGDEGERDTADGHGPTRDVAYVRSDVDEEGSRQR